MSSLGDLDAKPQTYSRKEKSLGLLCVNFLNHYTQEQVESISLDEAACRLGVERRRIYDIVNVLESVGVLVRKAKNRYTWKGYEGIPKALERLQEVALDGEDFRGVKSLTDVSEMKMHNARVCLDSDDEEHSSNENCPPHEKAKRQAGKRTANKSSPVSVLTEASKGSSPTKSKADCRREKSLGLLTQKFVQLFLVTQVKIVSLDDAARLLLGECNESAKLKTKVRRLYDIANILSSLNLIEKTHSAENRKPAFKWLGVKENTKYPLQMATRKRQFGTVLSTNTSPTSTDTGTVCGLPKIKRGRPSSLDKNGMEFRTREPLKGAKNSSTLRPLQPRCSNIGGAVYNPVPLYPREGSSMPVADVAASSAPRVPTNLTLGTSGGGWREWTTTDSNRASASSSEKNQKSGSGSMSESRSQCLDAPTLNRSGFPASNGASLSGSFSFGPFCPFRLQQQCLAGISSSCPASDHVNYQSDDSKDGECYSREHAVVTPFPLHYQNEAMDQMFVHYMNAWKSWCLQVTTNASSAAASPVTCAQGPCDTSCEEDG